MAQYRPKRWRIDGKRPLFGMEISARGVPMEDILDVKHFFELAKVAPDQLTQDGNSVVNRRIRSAAQMRLAKTARRHPELAQSVHEALRTIINADGTGWHAFRVGDC